MIKQTLTKFSSEITTALVVFFNSVLVAHGAALDLNAYPWVQPNQTPAGFVARLYQVSLGVAAACALGVILYGAIRYAVSGGNASSQGEARKWISGAIWGLVLLLAAYIILWTINPDLVNLIDPGLPAANVTAPAANYTGFGNIASFNIGGDPVSFNNLVSAIVQVESSGNPNATRTDCKVPSDTTTCVTSYGLMQVTPAIAKHYNSSISNSQNLSGLSDAQIGNLLIQNPNYNKQIGTAHLQDLNTQYDGDVNKIVAAYNGGLKANLPSVDCPGQLAWQCPYDHDTSGNKISNTGYIPTKNYVKKVNSVFVDLQESNNPSGPGGVLQHPTL